MVYYACLTHFASPHLVRRKCSVTMTFRLMPNFSVRTEYALLWKCHDGILPEMTRTLPSALSRRVFSRMRNVSIFHSPLSNRKPAASGRMTP